MDISITGTYQLSDSDDWIQKILCVDASRTVQFPAFSLENHPFFLINTSPASYTLTVKNFAGDISYATIPPYGGVLALPDGDNWKIFWAMNYSTGSTISSAMGNNLAIIRNGQIVVAGQNYNSIASIATQFQSSRARGSMDSPSSVNSGDTLFRLIGQGWNGFSFGTAGVIDIRSNEAFASGSHGGRFVLALTGDGSSSTPQVWFVDNHSNMCLGNLAVPTGGGTPVLLLAQASGNPTGLPSNSAGIFAKDVAGTCELFAVDEAGNVNQLSAHAQDAPEWLYDEIGVDEVHRSENIYLGRIIWRNESRKDRLIQLQLDGLPLPNGTKRKFIYEETYTQYNSRMGLTRESTYVAQDWDTVHLAIKRARDTEIDLWDMEKSKLDELKISNPDLDVVMTARPIPYEIKPKPKSLH